MATESLNQHPAPADNYAMYQQEVDALLQMQFVSPTQPLVFATDPSCGDDFVWPNLAEMSVPNQGPHRLTSHRNNAVYHFVEDRLCHLLHALGREHHATVEMVHDALDVLTHAKRVEWKQQRSDKGIGPPFVNTESFFRPIELRFDRLLHAMFLVSLTMELLFFTPRRGLRVMLAGLKDVLRVAGLPDETIQLLPKDPRPPSDYFNLRPTAAHFITCPSCDCLYPWSPGDSPDADNSPSPMHCTHQRTPQSRVCNQALWKAKQVSSTTSRWVPIRKYQHQSLKAWVGRLVSRKGMEALIAGAYATQPADPSPSVDDIWRSRVFQQLEDADGRPFLPGPSTEGRLVFSMSVDGFNPFHNKTAKQNVTSTGIWLVLLNLPQHLRYLQENMFLAGVIPNKPSLTDIYHYLDLVVAELSHFWQPGVYLSRTEQCRMGKLFRGMLVPLVCDMLAARQVIGMGPPTAHNFCTFCDIDSDNIHIHDRTEWPAKDVAVMRHCATRWRDASSKSEQQELFKMFSLRWSPLYALPYWDPVRFTVVDSMHALDLNLLANHCHNLFRIDVVNVKVGGDGASPPSSPENRRASSRSDIADAKKALLLIQQNDEDLLENLLMLSRKALYTICVDNNIVGHGRTVVIGVARVLAEEIVRWRRHPSYEDTVLGEMERSAPRSRTAVPAPPEEPDLDALTIRVMRELVGSPDHTPEESLDNAYRKGTAVVFQQICTVLKLDVAHIDMGARRTAKRSLFNTITAAMQDNPALCDELLPHVPEIQSPSGRVVLGRDVMQAIWGDMSRTVLPTWISRAPPNWGTAARGKLSADNWRVICTIHLPISLIRLWESSNITGERTRKQLMLDHFMDLVTSVRIANMRISSASQIEQFTNHLARYVANLSVLFPDEHLKPTHHTALHLSDMLGLFGPNHSHSGPHYERYINFFHRINTNKKIGELESTLFHTANRSSNLRAILNDDPLARDRVGDMISVSGQVQQEYGRGFRLALILDPNSATFKPPAHTSVRCLEQEHLLLLCHLLGHDMEIDTMPQLAKFMTQVSINNVTYGIRGGPTFANSSIMFHDRDQTRSDGKAACIESIFIYTYASRPGQWLEGIFLVVQELHPIDPAIDPYRRYHPFGGFLCMAPHSQSTTRVIAISQVISHFASTKMAAPYDGLLHVLPVDRLMFEFNADLGLSPS